MDWDFCGTFGMGNILGQCVGICIGTAFDSYTPFKNLQP